MTERYVMNGPEKAVSGTWKIRKKRLKNPPYGSDKASFWFVNTKNLAEKRSPENVKGHQTHRRFLYFESCVCQKK